MERLTCVEEPESVIKSVLVVHLGVPAIDDESISNQQTGMADARARRLSFDEQWKAGQLRRCLNQPQISLDGRAIDQASHEINVPLL